LLERDAATSNSIGTLRKMHVVNINNCNILHRRLLTSTRATGAPGSGNEESHAAAVNTSWSSVLVSVNLYFIATILASVPPVDHTFGPLV